jgi:transposase
MNSLRFVGMDVHAQKITVAVAEANNGEVRVVGEILNREEAIRRMIQKLGPVEQLRVCYEAGPTGYTVQRQLSKMGVDCVVVAPSLIPVKASDRVKTDRRDARKLARCHRAGDLTAVFVPGDEQEALRDLVRAREAAKKDQTRARHRLTKLLMRQGQRAPEGVKAWTKRYWEWVMKLTFPWKAQQVVLEDYRHEVEHCEARLLRLEKAIHEAIQTAPEVMRSVIEGLQGLRGVAEVTAVTMVSEVGAFSRFTTARQLMAYSGVVASEYSSGERVRQGGITKTGNSHLRRVVVESSWAYRHKPAIGSTLLKRQKKLSADVIEISWKAQQRLSGKYRKLTGRGKNQQQTIVAVARELLGFIWAIAVKIEARMQTGPAAAA